MTSSVLNAGPNGQVNPGETVDLGVWAENVGVDIAYGVYGLLSSSDPYVSLVIDSSWYGNIPAGDSVISNPYYQFTIANDCPNNHAIGFDLEFHDSNDSIWMSHPSVMVYAPILTYQGVNIMNASGILDPGETVDLCVTLQNDGGASAENVTSTLSTNSQYITINDNTGSFGTIAAGDTANNSADPYNIAADSLTPTGTPADFQVIVTAGVYVDTLQFGIVIGKKHYYIWNPDPTPEPGQNIHTILGNLGFTGDYGTSLAADLSLYQSVFVCVGIYSNNHVISSTSPEATMLVDFLQNQNGNMYLEGGDVWYYDPPSGYNFCPLFGIDAVADGTSDLGPVVGENNAFTTGMNFNYGGENSWIDHINPTGTGFLIFHDGNDNYNCGVANDAGTYKTVGTSFELGLLTDGTAPSTRDALLDSIMNFFGIGGGTGVEEYAKITGLPLYTELAAVYPNPGIRVMNIRYGIAHESAVSLDLYDAAGRLVRTLAHGVTEPGYYTVRWDGCDNVGRHVPAGVYFVKLKSEDYVRVEKTILLR
jgi:hypothetical protein